MTMFAPIYYPLASIDFCMRMHFLNRVRWLVFWDKFLNPRMTFFLDGGSTWWYAHSVMINACIGSYCLIENVTCIILHCFFDDVEFDLQQDNVASKSYIPALWVLVLLHIAILACLLLATDVTDYNFSPSLLMQEHQPSSQHFNSLPL